AATNKDLAAMVEQKTFRDDLYYRLNVLTVEIPPLRTRPDDVLILADYILKQLAQKMGKRLYGVSQEAKETLLRHPWRGNIRELQTALEHAVILSDGDLIRPEHLPFGRAHPPADSSPPLAIALPEAGVNLETLESQLIRQALQRAGNNLTHAAAL